MSKIQIVTPSHAAYDDVVAAVAKQRRKRIPYDTLANEYNDAPVDSMVLIEAPQGTKLSNVVKVLGGRGLIRNLDFSILRMKEDAEGNDIPRDKQPITITKLTDNRMK